MTAQEQQQKVNCAIALISELETLKHETVRIHEQMTTIVYALTVKPHLPKPNGSPNLVLVK